MILRQQGGPQITLSILGYQFPDGSDWHDLNWLNVLLRVETIGAHWTGGPDPCLLTTEAAELVVWLRAAAGGSTVKHLEFLEPELSFDIARPPEDRGIPVAVTLRQDFVKAQTLVAGLISELPLVLYVAPADLLEAAAQLENDLLRFPERHPVP
jgi:hypothetical protein